MVLGSKCITYNYVQLRTTNRKQVHLSPKISWLKPEGIASSRSPFSTGSMYGIFSYIWLMFHDFDFNGIIWVMHGLDSPNHQLQLTPTSYNSHWPTWVVAIGPAVLLHQNPSWLPTCKQIGEDGGWVTQRFRYRKWMNPHLYKLYGYGPCKGKPTPKMAS